MVQVRKNSLPKLCQALRKIGCWLATAFAFAIVSALPAPLRAQHAPTAAYAIGNAVVTGFSGALPPGQIAPGGDPDTLTFIDVDGASLRVVDLQHLYGPPAAQLVGAPKPLSVPAGQIGQVFGVAFDDGSPPNIYAAATSVYGLPIVVAGSDGELQHIRVGATNAAFMPGLWGPQGGPGSIWKIDGATGRVTLFANVMLGSRTNSGPALGGLAFDPDSKSLFVADRETGFIHRFGLDGRELGRYGHGVTGRVAQGLQPVRWDSRRRIDITSSQFDSAQPATWNYAAPERRIFGLAVYQHRLYYAVANGLQIWSVGLHADGSFGNDPTIELAVPPSSGPTEISKITFDEQGRMVLAERPAPTGAFDFEALAVPSIGRVLRYAVVGTTTNGRRIWQPSPDEYAIGFPADFRNDNGGVAIGYSYNVHGDIDLGRCGGFVWTTGEDLRESSDAKLAAQLGQSGDLDVAGLQGNGTWQARPANAPPLNSYFIAYVDESADAAARGHMGDIAVERQCPPTKPASIVPLPRPSSFSPRAPGVTLPCPPGRECLPTGAPTCPPGQVCSPSKTTPRCMPWQICGPGGHPVCPPNQIVRVASNTCQPTCERPDVLVNGRCCAVGALAANGACSNSSCPTGQVAIGPSNFCCNSSQVYTGGGGAQACCSGSVVNGQCQTIPKMPVLNCPAGSTNPQCCANGYVSTGSSCCLAGQMTSTGICCPSGLVAGGTNKNQCVPRRILPIPIGGQCCAAGQIPAGNGGCCPAANLTTTGMCCPGPLDPDDRSQCPAQIQLIPTCGHGYTRMPNGSCCNNRFVGADGRSCNAGKGPCAPGEFRDLSGACVPILPPACPRDEVRNREGLCVPIRAPCGPDEVRDREGVCVPVRPRPCDPYGVRERSGQCSHATPLPPRIFRPERPRRPIAPPPRHERAAPPGHERAAPHVPPSRGPVFSRPGRRR